MAYVATVYFRSIIKIQINTKNKIICNILVNYQIL